MTRLGYGTGVNVYLMKRGPKEGLPRSPWAIKRLNQFGKKMKSQIMERMKTEIEILRNFKHPNIIAFRLVQKFYFVDYIVHDIAYYKSMI